MLAHTWFGRENGEIMKRLFAKSLIASLAAFAMSSASANLITNPGFESGMAGWSFGGVSFVLPSNFIPTIVAYEGNNYACLGCAPDDGISGNATQNITLPGPGTYTFGGAFQFATSAAGGNFDQGQMSLFLSGIVNEVVGGDPNSFGGFSSCIGGAFVCSAWTTLSKTFVYSGVGPASILVNVSMQDFTNGKPTVLYADAIHVEKVPEPSTLALLGAGLLALGVMRVRRRTS